MSGFTNPGCAARRVRRYKTGTHTAWKARPPNDGPKGDWELLIDSGSGDVLRAEDKAFYATDGTGCVPPDPLSPTRKAATAARDSGQQRR